VYDVCEQDGVHYLTMEYIEGKPLSDFIRAGKGLAQKAVASLVRKLALALEEAHKRGVVHRDLKPLNIMMKDGKDPVIMDFGLARLTRSGDARLTQPGQAMGTPAYMALEQLQGQVDAVGPRSDIYSLGVILYELLTGRLPFEGSYHLIVGLRMTQEPQPPSAYRPDLDRRLEAICLKAMARTSEQRYASMAEFGHALAEFLKAAPGTPEVVQIPAVLPVAATEPTRSSRTIEPARHVSVAPASLVPVTVAMPKNAEGGSSIAPSPVPVLEDARRAKPARRSVGRALIVTIVSLPLAFLVLLVLVLVLNAMLDSPKKAATTHSSPAHTASATSAGGDGDVGFHPPTRTEEKREAGVAPPVAAQRTFSLVGTWSTRPALANVPFFQGPMRVTQRITYGNDMRYRVRTTFERFDGDPTPAFTDFTGRYTYSGGVLTWIAESGDSNIAGASVPAPETATVVWRNARMFTALNAQGVGCDFTRE
jgi:hypothetical protein